MPVKERTQERELLERVRNSDREALGELFALYQPVLFRQLTFQTGRTDLAHDIVQETFLRIWEHRSGLRPRLSFLAYALRIGRNIFLDHLRQKRVREKLKDAVPPLLASEGDIPDEAVQLSMLQEALARVMYDDLAERCRTILILSRFEGKSNKEIAALLGLSVRTVENQINHALKVLRRNLKGFVDS